MLFRGVRSTPASWQGQPRQSRFFAGLLLSVGLAFAALSVPARGDDDTIPEPEDIQLKTNDGVDLHATFYAGTQKKESVPIILLHAWKGRREDFQGLALLLQKQGHAVIVPDLRGHGDSTSAQRFGQAVKIDAATMRPGDFESMVGLDLETVKSYLMQRNNAGELNIEKLCVVGAEMGALVAAQWAALDWSWDQYGSRKQGQDVKAIVLLSPEANFKGLQITDAIGDPNIRNQIGVMLIAGKKNSKSREEANRLYNYLKKYHVDKKKKDLVLKLVDTKLQGTRLLNERSLSVGPQIVQFVNQLVPLPFPWAERKKVIE